MVGPVEDGKAVIKEGKSEDLPGIVIKVSWIRALWTYLGKIRDPGSI